MQGSCSVPARRLPTWSSEEDVTVTFTIALVSFLVTAMLPAQQAAPPKPEPGELFILEGSVGQSTQSQRLQDLTEEELFNPPVPSGAFKIPKDQIPVYHCVSNFFSVPVRVHIRNDDLNSLLEQMGITPTLVLRAHVIQLSGKSSDKSSRFSSLMKYEDDPETWEKEQYKLIEREIQSFKKDYDDFLDACEDEGLDSDDIHEKIVRFGRDITAMGASGDLDPRHKRALRIMEDPTINNPLLEE